MAAEDQAEAAGQMLGDEMGKSVRATFAVVGALLLTSGVAAAASPAAMVEDVTGTSAGVGPLDYLPAGKAIKLAAADRIVLDYLHSCIRETITGSSLVVGAEQSTVHGGTIARETVSCDGGQLQLSADQSQKSETIVFRKSSTGANLPPAQRTLYGLSPLFELPGPGEFTLERLDKPAPKIVLSLAAADLDHRRFYDFAAHGEALAGGGLYRASFEGTSIVFRLAKTAEAGALPPITRLLQL
jgi:hypothetical protein